MASWEDVRSYLDSIFGDATLLNTRAITDIQFAHRAVHEDTLISFAHLDTDVDILTPLIFGITAPTGYDIHITPVVKASKPCTVEVFRNEEFTGGSDVPQIRNNFESSSSIAATPKYGVTITGTPTAGLTRYIFADSAGAGAAETLVAGDAQLGEEYELGPSDTLIIRVTAVNDDTVVEIEGSYYEVEL